MNDTIVRHGSRTPSRRWGLCICLYKAEILKFTIVIVTKTEEAIKECPSTITYNVVILKRISFVKSTQCFSNFSFQELKKIKAKQCKFKQQERKGQAISMSLAVALKCVTDFQQEFVHIPTFWYEQRFGF